jgi:hypothetical protein
MMITRYPSVFLAVEGAFICPPATTARACFGLPKHIQTLRWTLTTFFLCRFCGRTC